MKRTQIYLSEEEASILSYLSVSKKKPMSELIREAIDRFYLHTKKINFIQALHQVTGIWKDRKDIGTTATYARNLRVDRRSGISR